MCGRRNQQKIKSVFWQTKQHTQIQTKIWAFNCFMFDAISPGAQRAHILPAAWQPSILEWTLIKSLQILAWAAGRDRASNVLRKTYLLAFRFSSSLCKWGKKQILPGKRQMQDTGGGRIAIQLEKTLQIAARRTLLLYRYSKWLLFHSHCSQPVPQVSGAELSLWATDEAC